MSDLIMSALAAKNDAEADKARTLQKRTRRTVYWRLGRRFAKRIVWGKQESGFQYFTIDGIEFKANTSGSWTEYSVWLYTHRGPGYASGHEWGEVECLKDLAEILTAKHGL